MGCPHQVIKGGVLEGCRVFLGFIPKCWLNSLATGKGLKDHPEPKRVAPNNRTTSFPSLLKWLVFTGTQFPLPVWETLLTKTNSFKESKKESSFHQPALEFHQVILLNLNQNSPWLIMWTWGDLWGGGLPYLSSQENTSCMFANKKAICRDASVGKQIRKIFIWGKLHLHYSCLQYLSSPQAVLNHLPVLHFRALPAASAHPTQIFFHCLPLHPQGDKFLVVWPQTWLFKL